MRYNNLGESVVFSSPVSGDATAFRIGFGTNLKITKDFHWEIFQIDYEALSKSVVFQQATADFWSPLYNEPSINWKGLFAFSTSFKVNLVRKKY